MRTYILVFGASLALGACKGDGPVASDVRLDAAGDRSRPGEQTLGDTRAVDRGRDGPRPPAIWKALPGAPITEQHTLTLLASGDALLVGGLRRATGVPDIYLDIAVRFDALPGTFVAAGNLAAPRAGHTATLLADGRVLVVGGGTTNPTKTVELYDPAKPAATAWSAGPELLTWLTGHTATRLASGKVLVAGGYIPDASESLTQLSLFDPAASAWIIVGATLKEPRRRHTATLLKNGKVLLAGGVQGKGGVTVVTYLTSLELYDPTTGLSTLVTPKMSRPRADHMATLLDDGRVLLAGGLCAGPCKGALWVNDLYDPVMDKLTPLSSPTPNAIQQTDATLADGRVLIIGDADDETKSAKVWAYTKVGTWDAMPDLNVGRWGTRAVRLGDGTVLVVGGVKTANPRSYPDAAERLIP